MLKKLPLAILFSLLSTGKAYSLGFGEISVLSNLNEPLKIHIQLVDSKSVPLDEISVTHADIGTYQKANLPRPDVFNKVKFNKVKLANGSVIAVLTSKKAIREPFITFIADLKWRTGQINREYTFLLDPPEFVKQQSQPLSRKKNISPTKQTEVAKPKPSKYRKKTKRKNIRTKPSVDHSAVIAAHVRDNTYQIKKADTLWNIAKKIKPDNSVTTYQTMQALFVLNPDAFIRNDINLIKQGQLLSIPNRDEILQINGKKPLPASKVVARSKPSSETGDTKSQESAIIQTPDKKTDMLDKAKTETISETENTGRLKIIPPDELLNKPVNSREDLKLINKALKTSIDTIKLLKDENDQLSAQIQQLNEKLNSLDSQNEQLDNQIAEINSYIKDNNSSKSTTADSSTQLAQTDDKAVETGGLAIQSDIKVEPEKSVSFVRQLLGNPMITLALAAFAVIILIALLLTARKQSELRKLRQQHAYRARTQHDIPQERPEQDTGKPVLAQTNNVTAKIKEQPDTTEPLPESSSKAPSAKDDDGMDFFEYFEQKINSSDSSTESDSAENNSDSDEIGFSLDVSEQDIQDYETKIAQSYEQNTKQPTSSSPLSEVDTYIAYGNYEKAEALILSALHDSQDDKHLHLKLLESYSLSNKRNEYMQHLKSIINILHEDMVLRHRIENMYQKTWNEPLNIDKFT